MMTFGVGACAIGLDRRRRAAHLHLDVGLVHPPVARRPPGSSAGDVRRLAERLDGDARNRRDQEVAAMGRIGHARQPFPATPSIADLGVDLALLVAAVLRRRVLAPGEILRCPSCAAACRCGLPGAAADEIDRIGDLGGDVASAARSPGSSRARCCRSALDVADAEIVRPQSALAGDLGLEALERSRIGRGGAGIGRRDRSRPRDSRPERRLARARSRTASSVRRAPSSAPAPAGICAMSGPWP